MSETVPFPPISELHDNQGGGSASEASNVRRTPTVYFIDDSATMREVIKIAFRRENYNVITCADAASALTQFEQNRPDIVITDVIMPDQDGYSVCSHIKQHPDFGGTPVVLMSGVVNKSVADKAVSVQADELVRKPFQPQELINRVKALLDPRPAQSAQPTPDRAAPSALSSLFAPQSAQSRPAYPAQVPPPQAPQSSAGSWSQALADAFTPRPSAPSAPAGYPPPLAGPHVTNPASPSLTQPNSLFAQNPAGRPPSTPADMQKLRLEIARLDLLVKKLQTELQIERQYNQALESQIRVITESA
jgi:CheY-like chemotaxis protein